MVAYGPAKSRYNEIWRANPGGQRNFLSCPYYEALMEGTRGGGKTEALLMDFAQFVGLGFGPAWRGILFRETYPNLEDVVAKSLKWFPRAFPGAEWKGGKYCWVFPCGERLYFRHAAKPSDYWKYHGHEYPWVGWEELTNWPSDELYLSMMSVCRSSFPGLPRHYRGTCNPFGVGHHWVKGRFIDPMPRQTPYVDPASGLVRVAVHSELSECPQLTKNDPDYVRHLQALDGPKRQAWLFGDWNIVAGGMFGDLWNERLHVVDPFEIPPSWHVDRSFDWGSYHPYSVGWWAQSDGSDVKLKDGTRMPTRKGDLFRIAELYGWTGKPNEGSQELASDIALKIKAVEAKMDLDVRPGPADTQIFSKQDGHCIADSMAAEGVYWTEADKSGGSRINGWELMRIHLKNVSRPYGPRLFVFPNCRQFIRTVPVLPRDPVKMDDVDTESEDHCLHGGTPVVTAAGVVRIADLVGTTGDVLTVGGVLAPYRNCRLTRTAANVVRMTFEDGSTVTCTPDHKFLTSEGWMEAQQWKSSSCRARNRVLLAKPTTGAACTSSTKADGCIGPCGSTTMAQSPPGSTFTMLTAIPPTMLSRTSPCTKAAHTASCTTPRATATIPSPTARAMPPGGGIHPRPEVIGTADSTKSIAWMPSCGGPPRPVCCVASRSWGKSGLSTARTNARRPPGEHPVLMTRPGCASPVASRSPSTATRRPAPVPGSAAGELLVVSVEDAGMADVYCMEVDETRCFVLGNGVVSHNCGDEARYRIASKHYASVVAQL
jgi:hypothetical protein